MAKLLLSVRIENALMESIDDLALIENRDRTNMVEHALMTYLRQNHREIWAKYFPELAKRATMFDHTKSLEDFNKK